MNSRTPLVAVALTLVTAPAIAHEGEGPHDHGAEKPAPAPYVVKAGVEAEEDGPAPPAPKPDAAPVKGPSADPSEEDLHERPSNIPSEPWRRSQRRGHNEEDGAVFDPDHFHFELRFGLYSPSVDDEPGLTGTPYADFFGTSPLFHFGMELDWLPLYIPYVGSLGPGFGWGYSRARGPALNADATPAESKTSLNIFPFHASAVFRFDGIFREAKIPLVPYGKVGFGWAIWDVSAPSGTASVTTPDGRIDGEGTSYGIHAAAGGALILNGFDPSAAMTMKEETGIRYAAIFAEWYGQFLGEVGPSDQLFVGTSTVVFGLSLDF